MAACAVRAQKLAMTTTTGDCEPTQAAYARMSSHVRRARFCIVAIAMGLVAFTGGMNSFSVIPGVEASSDADLCTNVTTPTNVTTTNTTTNATVTELKNITTCVACENVVTLQNVTTTTTNATDNTTETTWAMTNVTECVPLPTTTTTTTTQATTTTEAPSYNTTKISGSLEVKLSVPEGTTVAALNSNVEFKEAIADTIKEALALGANATVVVTEISAKAGAAAGADASTRRLAKYSNQRGAVQRHLSESSALELDIKYEITLPEEDAVAVFKKIADKETFAEAVKTKSVAKLESAGFTGYTVDSVVAKEATGDMAPAPVATTTEDPTSGAFSKFGTTPLTAMIAVVGAMFSVKLA